VGRPKGSKNKKSNSLPPTFRLLKEQFNEIKESMQSDIEFFVGDGKYGNNTCANLCIDYGYYLVSKLQYNSALYLRYDGEQKNLGRNKLYGKKLDFQNLEKKYLVKEEISGKEITRF